MPTLRSDHYTYSLVKKLIDLSSDSIKVLLMRNGFVFNQASHGTFINIETNTGAIALTFASTDKSVSRGSGSFVTDGFVVGNYCTCDATLNPGPFTIATVTALKITFNETVADEGPVTKTLTSNDELATGSGYTQNTMTTGTVTVTEDDVNHYTSATFPTVTWNASGGSIGPTPGAILFDDTSSDKTIIGYIDFEGNQTATTGTPLSIANGTIREL
jgi:hypothetical protein